MSQPELMEFARGAGCGCKIAPAVLEKMLAGQRDTTDYPALLVGNKSNDDAAVLDLGNGQSLISTTDFFTPVVNDAYDYGRIAAANSISDVYAMGGKPVLALAVLGWPVEKTDPAIASRVMAGARDICAEAGIPLAGGHSIDSPEPFFGLAVNGLIKTANIKRNNTAKEGDLIYLTKPLGTGILSAAMKKGVLKAQDRSTVVSQMSTLNAAGSVLGEYPFVTSMTDVTGFGLMGHLCEICAGSNLSAVIKNSNVQLIKNLREYLPLNIRPDATFRNWNAYSAQVVFEQVDMNEAFAVWPDPQTNGGLLFTASKESAANVSEVLIRCRLEAFAEPVGYMAPANEKLIRVVK
jgi:selenide, water dikinase